MEFTVSIYWNSTAKTMGKGGSNLKITVALDITCISLQKGVLWLQYAYN